MRNTETELKNAVCRSVANKQCESPTAERLRSSVYGLCGRNDSTAKVFCFMGGAAFYKNSSFDF
ncbi:MAG: hypothetical protein RR829_01895 [Oscillospiraceae bacterium]